jgi:phosphoribosylaminoimidazole carboxylase
MAEAEYQITPLIELFDSEKSGAAPQAVAQRPSKAGSASVPVVGIIMGSDSDLPVMKLAAGILREFEVPFELTIVSAHRTPERMVTYAKEARSRGIKAIIAGAGGAAHLPGMVAALCTLPVIGVPVKGSSLDGVDSLHSIVQMPRGVPTATVAINNATNGALLALRIISTEQSALGLEIRGKLEEYHQKMESGVMEKVERLEKEGWEDYVVKK